MTDYLKNAARAALAATVLITAPACAHPHTTPTPQPIEAVSAADLELGPALWKVADEDTTIYLFGTVHVLPKDVEWFDGQIKSALSKSEELVTEVDTRKAAELAPQMVAAGTLPAGTTLRSLLSDDDRAKFETALNTLGVPPQAFDQYEPWFAALNLSMLPLLLDGWNPEAGVETVLHQAAGDNKKTGELESAQFQIDMFDKLPQETQIDYLNQIVAGLPAMKSTMDTIVQEWAEGDADAIGQIISGTSDDQMYKIVFSNRNANWAVWIDDRLDTPGIVFVAVGAGHLAGKDSVQDYLAARGIAVTRLQ